MRKIYNTTLLILVSLITALLIGVSLYKNPLALLLTPGLAVAAGFLFKVKEYHE